VPGLEESLRQVLDVGGARTAALVDVSTGMIVAAAGAEPLELAAGAAGLADEFRLAATALAPGTPAGDLDEMLLTTSRRLHLVKVLGRWQDEGLMLFVDLDRSRTNAALAVAQIAKAAPAVLA
jgi:hypothetical protein